MFSYKGKKALDTGGGRGIGRVIALAFARQDADVAVVARSPQRTGAGRGRNPDPCFKWTGHAR
jgi:NAD(P)-dependent dehydrogenase (short-subunit alcohol dehydrogenase family)